MRICHFTNTFLPHVGGVARAVQTLLEDQRRARHRVLVVAPEFEEGGAPVRIERSVARIPAITKFNRSDFSMRIPIASALSDKLAAFKIDLIHSHHPFLLGDTALREAATRGVPVVFTHHTLYERYTHYLPLDSDQLQEMVSELATRYANRCHAVIAPSASLRDLIVERGVITPVHIVPTGIDTALLAKGDATRARHRWKLAGNAPVIGHLGRLAAEKNLAYLAAAIAVALIRQPEALAIIIGDGPARGEMETLFRDRGVADRVRFTGQLSGARLRDAFATMHVFAFASTSETQGLVLAEAMAVGAPVVALDASGTREVVRDGENGRLLPADTPLKAFGAVLADTIATPAAHARWSAAARRTAAEFDRLVTSRRMFEVYADVAARHPHRDHDESLAAVFEPVLDRIATEARLLADKAGAIMHAVAGSAPVQPSAPPLPAAPGAHV